MKFAFETTENTRVYCIEVVECLKTYCGKSGAEAIQLVNTYWIDEGTFTDLDFRLHEDPYYWAMCIAHDRVIGDNRLDWDKDPTLWPPPKEFYERWYNPASVKKESSGNNDTDTGYKIQEARSDLNPESGI